jgi:hypothetical protein
MRGLTEHHGCPLSQRDRALSHMHRLSLSVRGMLQRTMLWWSMEPMLRPLSPAQDDVEERGARYSGHGESVQKSSPRR